MASSRDKGKKKKGRRTLTVPADSVPEPTVQQPEPRRRRERALTVRTGPPRIDPADLEFDLGSTPEEIGADETSGEIASPLGLDFTAEDLASAEEDSAAAAGEDVEFENFEEAPTAVSRKHVRRNRSEDSSASLVSVKDTIPSDIPPPEPEPESTGQSIEITLEELGAEELDIDGDDDRPEDSGSMPPRPASVPPPPPKDALTESTVEQSQLELDAIVALAESSSAPEPEEEPTTTVSKPTDAPQRPSSIKKHVSPLKTREESPPPPPTPRTPSFDPPAPPADEVGDEEQEDEVGASQPSLDAPANDDAPGSDEMEESVSPTRRMPSPPATDGEDREEVESPPEDRGEEEPEDASDEADEPDAQDEPSADGADEEPEEAPSSDEESESEAEAEEETAESDDEPSDDESSSFPDQEGEADSEETADADEEEPPLEGASVDIEISVDEPVEADEEIDSEEDDPPTVSGDDDGDDDESSEEVSEQEDEQADSEDEPSEKVSSPPEEEKPPGVVLVGQIQVIGTGGPTLEPQVRKKPGEDSKAAEKSKRERAATVEMAVPPGVLAAVGDGSPASDEDVDELDLSEVEEIRESQDSIEIQADSGSVQPPPPPADTGKPPPPPAGAKTPRVGSLTAPSGKDVAGSPQSTPTSGSPPPPPKSSRPAPSRNRRKPWWEEMFNDDYLRSLPELSERFTQKEVDFMEAALGVKPGGMILDLACGNGRHAVELSCRGFQVVGLDLSLAMLSRAAELAQKVNQKINFIHGDMREMAFESTFDGAICQGTSFGYFDDETNIKVIDGLRRALKTRGMLIIETANRDFLISRQPNMVWFEGDGCVCMEESSFNYITSRLAVKRSLLFDDGRQIEHEFSIRVYSLHELGKILHTAGFRVAEISGHIHTPGAFFGVDSTNLIILAEKRDIPK